MTSASFRGLAALAAALMLTGCATEPESPELFFWVKPGVRAALPDSPCGADMTENAILTAVRDGRTERLLTVRACRGGLMSLDVMTLTGMALMSVTYDGTMLVSTNYVPLPKELRAEQIVADILMGTLPAEAWTTLPSGYHLRIEEKSRTLVNALGEDDAILANLAEGRAPGMEGPLVRTVDGFEAPFGRVTIDLPDTNPPSSRNNRLLRACWNLRKTEFESRLKDFEDERIAVVLGTSTSGSQEFSDWWKARKFGSEMPPFAGEWQEMGDPSRDFASFVGAKGPAYTIATACTSSARAIISAARLLEAGLADAVIAGGADTFADMPLNGFHALGVLAGERTRPLTDHRPGITIGEGAGLMLLTRRPSAVKLSGWGESSDGHHMSSPEPEGRGAEAAVRGALSRAGLTPDDIVYVNLHGTGTGQNDASELAAMNRVFGGRTAMSSTKTYTGHTLGAAGVTDAGLLVLGLMHGGLKLPAQFSEGQTPDETLPLSGVLREPALIAPGPVMSTNLAFGGSNTALIFEPNS